MTLIQLIAAVPKLPLAILAVSGAQRQLRADDLTWLTKVLSNKTNDTSDNSDERSIETAESWHRAVSVGVRFFSDSKDCLPRSLALYDLLRSRGLKPELCLGVAKKQGIFAAHAWVEVSGQAIREPSSVKQEFSLIAAKEWMQIRQ
ncbi:MAG: lasso peptide biosynthesis B2 protein [Pseudomonadota bacterium]